jgi:hypothetical protein
MVQYDAQAINQYLAGQLQGDALEQFEIQLLTNESLQRNVEEHRSLKTALQLSEQEGSAPIGWLPPVNIYSLEFLRTGTQTRLVVEAHKPSLISIDLGPDEFANGHFTLKDTKGTTLVDLRSVSDEEGLMDVVIPALEPGDYKVDVTGAVKRSFVVEAS